MDVLDGFEWDEHNRDKNALKHKVSTDECEEIFYNEPLLIFGDERHSRYEQRFVAYGLTDTGRTLTIVFTRRKNKIRVISARSQSRKERRLYEKNKSRSYRD